MHGGTGPHIKPAARAVRYHHCRLPAEFAGYHQLLGVSPRQQRSLLPDAADALDIVGGDRLGGVAPHGAAVDQPRRSITPGLDGRDRKIVGYR